MLFALVPLFFDRDAQLIATLRDRQPGGGPRRLRLRSALVTLQIALAVLLTVGSTLLAEGYRWMTAVRLGVTTDDVLVLNLELGSRYRDRTAASRFIDRLRDGGGSLPGAVAADVVYDHPLETNWTQDFALAGRAPDRRRPWGSELRFATAGYFHDLGIGMVAGRELDPTPGRALPAQRSSTRPSPAASSAAATR